MNLIPKKIGAALRSVAAVRANPSRDWLLLLCVGAILLAGSVIWNLWYFDQIVTRGIEVQTNAAPAASAYEPAAVQEIFAARATTSAAYQTAYPFIDPSR